jgi:hypothetical protein
LQAVVDGAGEVAAVRVGSVRIAAAAGGKRTMVSVTVLPRRRTRP